jgi:transposase
VRPAECSETGGSRKQVSQAGRARKVKGLEEELFELCSPMWFADLAPGLEGPQDDYRRLVNELMRLLLAGELFTFVTASAATRSNGQTQEVGGTNNEAERTLRNPATARKTGRTNKTVHGARRQTIVTSVLESLRLYLETFTLAGVIEEVQSWVQTGRSCFEELLEQLGLALPKQSVLDEVLPAPSG